MFNMREWATPVTIGAFLISGLTGVLIFFHLNFGLIRGAHEWLSWFLVLGVVFHVWLNWKAFARYFSKRMGVSIIVLFAVLTIISLIPLGGSSGPNRRGGPPFAKAANALADVPLTTVALVAKREPVDLLNKLKAQGLSVINEQQSVKTIAEANKKNEMQILGMLFD